MARAYGTVTGIASLDDPRALGANVPVDVHVLYPDISFVVTFSLIAAFAGFIWAWLVHNLHDVAQDRVQEPPENEFFWPPARTR